VSSLALLESSTVGSLLALEQVRQWPLEVSSAPQVLQRAILYRLSLGGRNNVILQPEREATNVRIAGTRR
jgi:hypothetical protein